MRLGRNVISSSLMLLWLSSARTICPNYCNCKPDEKGRKKVSCLQGSMFDPVPTSEMDLGMEVLEISAPQSSWNELTLGPLFQGFKHIQELYIWRSSITQIGTHPFWGVPSLKVLSLKHNNISVIADHNFRGLVNLLELNLDNNKIVSVPAGAFKHLTELRILTLENNLIEELVPRMFIKLTKLQVLRLSGNPFSELDPEPFKDILELRVLECRGCGLRRINTQIYHLLPYITHLDLGNNQIQYLDDEEFMDLHKLRSLKLDGNQFPVVLEKTFVNNGHLRYLCLARNRLAKITNTAFLNLSNLVELDIGYNKLPKLEAVSLHPIADSLQKLVVSGNNFPTSVLRVIFQIATKLQDLALADLKITDVPEGLPVSLLRLNLSGNHLKNLSVEALPERLSALDISRNKFRGLEDRAIQRLVEIKDVNLFNNSWTCDVCTISPILFHANKSASFKNITCAYPKKLKGRKVTSLGFEEVASCDEDEAKSSLVKNKLGLLIGGAGLLVFLLFCIAFVVFSCVRRHAQQRPLEDKGKRSVEKKETVLEPTVIFGNKGEITFKFPLDLTERKLSVSTIDEMKKETPIRNVPNGTATGI